MTDPVQLATAVAEFQQRAERNRLEAGRVEQAGLQSQPTWEETLWRLYGGGNRPDLRRAIFRKIQRLSCRIGKKLDDQVRACIALAAGPDIVNPGNYFCRAINLRIIEHGLLDSFQSAFNPGRPDHAA